MIWSDLTIHLRRLRFTKKTFSCDCNNYWVKKRGDLVCYFFYHAAKRNEHVEDEGWAMAKTHFGVVNNPAFREKGNTSLPSEMLIFSDDLIHHSLGLPPSAREFERVLKNEGII